MTSIASPRDLERWMQGARTVLADRGVRTVFGRGLDLGDTGAGASSWISFASAVGSGRVVRGADGTCRLVAHRHADGQVLLDRSSDITSSVELDEMVDVLAPASRPA